jgi:tRNA threonylcarbamoyladenosine biosynthesis protein TsaE
MAGIVLVSRSARETRELGARLARALPEGTVVALTGELGAGKTTFVQGAAEGLGVRARAADEEVDEEGDVISPTFVLVREHTGSGGRTLIHVDAHRLAGAGDLADIGGGDFLGTRGLAFVEWADRVYDALPRPCLVIRFSHEAEGRRRLELGGLGPGHEALLALAAGALRGEAPVGRDNNGFEQGYTG